MDKKIRNLLFLGRYHKPYGTFLLMLPCFWGVALNSNFSINVFFYYILFFLGSFVMRGAGCTINDIFDSNFDKKIKRTKDRPIASKKVSIKEGFFFLLFQLFLGLLVLINFNKQIIFLSFLVVPLVIIYPLLKRVTFFPQIMLGIIFNWGIILGCFVNNNQYHISQVFLYMAGVFLTIGYDTIYALQDVVDDKKIGVKSLAIKICHNPKFYISIIYFISLIFFTISFGSLFSFDFTLIVLLSIIGFHLFCQIKNLDLTKDIKLMKIFKSNVNLGILIFLGILIKKNF